MSRMPIVRGPLRLVLDDERAEVQNMNGYDKGFSVRVADDGTVKVESAHFSEYVWQQAAFHERSVKGMKKAVERAKKRLQKQEEKLWAIKEEFKW